MLKKGTKLYSIVKMKCPRCHEGNLFVNANPYNIKTLGKMPEKCPVCGQSYSPEPGFYFGATYVSYALTLSLAAIVFAICYFVFGYNSREVIYIIAAAITLLSPIIFLLSRSIWINFFVSYDPKAAPKKSKAES